jgi:hypothetical protein
MEERVIGQIKRGIRKHKYEEKETMEEERRNK